MEPADLPRSTDWRSLEGAFRHHDPDADTIPLATNWQTLPPERAEKAWEGLRIWVEKLQVRFEFIDNHVVPPCWWRHNEHVEALVALRDHEKSSFHPAASATSPVEWIRALREVTSILRTWTADLPCGTVHRAPGPNSADIDDEEWAEHLACDKQSRMVGGSKPGIEGEVPDRGLGKEPSESVL